MTTAGTATSPVETGQIDFATVDFLKAGASHPHRSGFRRLRQGADLHVTLNGTAASSAAGLPPLLKQGSYYIPAEQGRADAEDLQVVIGANVPTQLYLIWPALQDLPGWCYQDFDLVRGAEVKVHWSLFTKQQRLYLNVTNQRRLYDDQTLRVFRLKGNHGYLMPGEEIELPYSGRRQGSPLQQPHYNHIICLRPSHQISGSGSGATKNTNSIGTKPISAYNLAEITMALEDGVVNPAELANREADSLLRLSIAAANEELLFMLLDGGIGASSSQPCLQLVLRYAQYEDSPQLALAVIQHSPVEITQPVLEWLVGHMVRRRMLQEAEVMLTQYCLNRRNPMSTIAAIEHALHKAAQSQLVVSQDVLQLVGKFNTAKLRLLQGLVKHYSGNNLEHRQFSSSGMPSGHRFLMQEVTASSNSDTPPLLRVEALQQAVKRCLQKTSAYMVGRGSSRAPVSIHDVSPYGLAISMQDVEFLQHPAVVEYSSRVWRGLELQKMAQAWQAAVSHAVHVASTEDCGLLARKGPCRRSAEAGGAASVCSAIPGPPAGKRAGSFLMGSFIDARGKNGFTAWGRPTGVQSAELDTAAASATLPDVPAPLVTSAADPSSQPEAAPGAYQQQRMGPATADEVLTETSRPVVTARLSTSFKGRPIAEAAEYDSTTNSGAVTPAAPGIGSPVRRRTTQDWATMTSSEDLEQPGVTHYSKTAWEGAVWLDPEAGSQLLQNLGLAGGPGQALCTAALRMLHGVLLTPRALQNRARNRWTQRCIFETWFLFMFVGYSFGFVVFFNCLPSLLMLVLGNIVGIAFEVRWIHNGNIKTYIRQHWSKIDVIVNFGFLAHLLWQLVVAAQGHDSVQGPSTMAQIGIPVEQVAASAYSVLVWARALGVLTPADARVGAMLFVLGRAAEEAAAFLPLVLVLIFGFSSTLYVMYHNLFEDYSTILGSLRMFALISLGGHYSLLDFEHGEQHDAFLLVWGQVIIILYGIIFNILILTLLIAVITKTYNTKLIKAKAVLMEAEAVNQYDWRVRHNMSASPINLWQVVFSWLPQGYRSRVPPAKCLRFGIPPLDGYVPELIAASPHMLLPTGPPEISYIWFIILQCSLLSLVALLLLILHLPFGVWHFASRGRLMWEESTWTGKGNQFTTERKNPASAAAAAARKSRRTNSSSGDIAGGDSGHCNAFLDLATPADSFSYGTSDGGGITGRHRTSGGGQQQPLQSMSALAATKKHVKAAVDTGIKAGRGGGTRVQCGAKRAGRTLARLIHGAGQTAVALVFALVAHLLLLVVAAVAVVLAQVSRVVFSLYCIFAPSAADCNCCMRPTRYADFWTQSDLRNALESAKLNVEQTYSAVQSLASVESATSLGKGPVQLYTDGTCQVSTRPTRFVTADDVLTHPHHVTLMPAPTRQVAGRQPQLGSDAVAGSSTLLWPTLPSLEAEVDSWQTRKNEAAVRK